MSNFLHDDRVVVRVGIGDKKHPTGAGSNRGKGFCGRPVRFCHRPVSGNVVMKIVEIRRIEIRATELIPLPHGLGPGCPWVNLNVVFTNDKSAHSRSLTTLLPPPLLETAYRSCTR